MQDAAGFLWMYAVFPLWVAAGLLDWWCHRATAIATTSGLKENLLHWLMYLEVGAGMAAALLCEFNLGLVLLLLALFLLHEGTVYADLAYSTVLRDVAPFEQMVHSFLELLPLVAIVLVVVTAWPLAGGGLQWKAQPLPLEFALVAAASSFAFNALPLAQETWRCVQARRHPPRKPRADRVEPSL